MREGFDGGAGGGGGDGWGGRFVGGGGEGWGGRRGIGLIFRWLEIIKVGCSLQKKLKMSFEIYEGRL